MLFLVNHILSGFYSSLTQICVISALDLSEHKKQLAAILKRAHLPTQGSHLTVLTALILQCLAHFLWFSELATPISTHLSFQNPNSKKSYNLVGTFIHINDPSFTGLL